MDEMKLKLSTKFMRGIVAKIISKSIYKSMGFKPEIQLNEIDIEMKDGKLYFHLNVDGSIDEKSFLKIAQVADLD